MNSRAGTDVDTIRIPQLIPGSTARGTSVFALTTTVPVGDGLRCL